MYFTYYNFIVTTLTVNSSDQANVYMPLDDFKQKYQAFLAENSMKRARWTKEHFMSTFSDLGLALWLRANDDVTHFFGGPQVARFPRGDTRARSVAAAGRRELERLAGDEPHARTPPIFVALAEPAHSLRIEVLTRDESDDDHGAAR